MATGGSTYLYRDGVDYRVTAEATSTDGLFELSVYCRRCGPAGGKYVPDLLLAREAEAIAADHARRRR
ncbi:hypothetical protein AB0K60_07125 [Thermopolyspora sp. NPDC052614]|uniref:hypothetical protein n=1 Tax=Thermopolyspora sp. NPDC052614 TaxID=3155682 RepID=UPI00342D9BA3